MAHDREEQKGKSILELWHEHFENGPPEANSGAVKDAVNAVSNVSSNGVESRFGAVEEYGTSNTKSAFDIYEQPYGTDMVNHSIYKNLERRLGIEEAGAAFSKLQGDITSFQSLTKKALLDSRGETTSFKID